MSIATQVRLANDIAAQFHHLPFEEGVTAVQNHMKSFWDRRMRDDLANGVDAGVWEIDRLAVAAIERLRPARGRDPERAPGRTSGLSRD